MTKLNNFISKKVVLDYNSQYKRNVHQSKLIMNTTEEIIYSINRTLFQKYSTKLCRKYIMKNVEHNIPFLKLINYYYYYFCFTILDWFCHTFT